VTPFTNGQEIAMSRIDTINQHAMRTTGAVTVELKLEVVIIPVTDVDRAKQFYGSLGWRLDADFAFDNGFRVVQFTPPGSECSIQFGTHVTSAAPGTAQDLYLVVSDIEAARKDLLFKGAAVTDVFHPTAPGAQFRPGDTKERASGRAPENASYRSFARFSDPDGNGWLLQEITSRLPGRGIGIDVATLTELLQETELHHGAYEPTAPKHHWSGWYAAYVVARERGRTPDEAAKEAKLHIERALASQA
jgi:catechol 2,3-dioxygenase-like lactoylglutathione lyase family enzyme